MGEIGLARYDLWLLDVVGVDVEDFHLGNKTQDWHFLDEIVAHVKLLQLGQLQVGKAKEVVLGVHHFYSLQVIQKVYVLQAVVGYVNFQQVNHHRGEGLELVPILETALSQV